MQWKDTTRGAVFNFSEFDIPKGATIKKVTLFSNTSGTCQAGFLSGKVGNVSAGPFSSSGFSTSGGFGSNQFVRSTATFCGLFPGSMFYCGGCFDPVYICSSSGLPSGTSYPTAYIQSIVNTGNLTSVAFLVEPFASPNLCFSPSDASTGETASFSVNNPGPAKLTIGYCEPLYSASGNVFVDVNENQLKDAVETNYTAGVSAIGIHTGIDALCSTATLGIPTPPPTPSCVAAVGGSCIAAPCCSPLVCTTIDIYTRQCTGTPPTPTPTSTPIPNPINTSTGTYATGKILPAGTYTFCYSSLPPGYKTTFPITSPAQFNLRVGPSCSTGTSNSATCGVLPTPTPTPALGCQATGSFGAVGDGCGGITCCNGLSCIPGDVYTAPRCPTPPIPTPDLNIINANIGIAPIITAPAWFQSKGSDMRWDSGFTDDLPSSKFASIAGAGGMPGIIFSGASTPSFGSGQASPTPFNWKVGSFANPDVFTDTHNLIPTSYRFLLETVDGSAIAKKGTADLCSGGLDPTICTLTPVLSNGVYKIDGDLTLTGSGYTFPASKNFVILVNGDLNIKEKILVPIGSTVIFSAKGNIKVNKTIGEIASSTTPTIEGLYSADEDFVADGNNDCGVSSDLRLNVGGAVVANAGRGGGTFVNNRSLCADGSSFPSVSFIERPDFMLNYPTLVKQTTRAWQEAAP